MRHVRDAMPQLFEHDGGSGWSLKVVLGEHTARMRVDRCPWCGEPMPERGPRDWPPPDPFD
jgi:hypothetical protein